MHTHTPVLSSASSHSPVVVRRANPGFEVVVLESTGAFSARCAAKAGMHEIAGLPSPAAARFIITHDDDGADE
eukprot:2515323-Rhodomonas_salina.2